MPESPPLPDRQSVRLPDYDYSRTGQYFVTICAFEKRNLFGSITDERVSLNAVGLIAQSCWMDIPNHFPVVDLAEFILMPNHLHGILSITNRARHAVPLRESSHAEAFSRPNPLSLATIVRSYKSQVSKQVRTLRHTSNFMVWQRGFYEHILRNPTDYANASRYILRNPKRFALNHNPPVTGCFSA